MATFKVGDRVRIVNAYGCHRPVIGQAGVITNSFTHHNFFPHLKYDWQALLDDGEPFVGPADHFAPLTDPKADAFLEKMRKLKPYVEREPVLIEVGDGLYVVKDGHE